MARKPSSEYSASQRAKAAAVADKYLPDPKAKATKPKKGKAATKRTKAEEDFARAKADVERLGRSHKPEPAPPSRELTDKEWRFAEEYVVDCNGTQAAIRAGYSEKTAAQIAYENLRKPEIRSVVDHLLKEKSKATGWTAQRLLNRLGDELEADLKDIHDETGQIRPIDEWPLVFRQGLIEGIEVESRTEDDGDTTIRIAKVKIASRHKLKEMIGKHVAVNAFTERVQHDVSNPLKQFYEQIVGTGARPSSNNSSNPSAQPSAQLPDTHDVMDTPDDGDEPPRAVPAPARSVLSGMQLNPSEATRLPSAARELSDQAPEEDQTE